MNQIKKVFLLLHNLRLLIGLSLLIQFSSFSTAEAFNWREDLVFGVMTGFGGSGVDEEVTDESSGQTFDESRSEGPGMVGISIETYLNDKWSLALSHRRGYKLGPFSMGSNFTGVIARRYFLRPAPFIPSQSLENSVTIQSWVPFVGLGGGLASGRIKRDGAVNEVIEASGIYMGIHLGVDYHLRPNLILRPEFFTSATFMDDSNSPGQVKEYGLVVGFHFRL